LLGETEKRLKIIEINLEFSHIANTIMDMKDKIRDFEIRLNKIKDLIDGLQKEGKKN